MLILEILKFRINSGNAEKSRNFAKKANHGKVLKAGSTVHDSNSINGKKSLTERHRKSTYNIILEIYKIKNFA